MGSSRPLQIRHVSPGHIAVTENLVVNKKSVNQRDRDMSEDVGNGGDAEEIFSTSADQVQDDPMDENLDGSGNPADVVGNGDRDPEDLQVDAMDEDIDANGGHVPEDVVRKAVNDVDDVEDIDADADVNPDNADRPVDGASDHYPEDGPKDIAANVDVNEDNDNWTPRSRSSSMSSLSTTSEDGNETVGGKESEKESSVMMDVDGEGLATTLDSSVDLSQAGPILGFEETHVAAQIELRRSGRNAHSKKQPTAPLVIPQKSSSRKTKLAQKKDEIAFQVSIPTNSPRKGC